MRPIDSQLKEYIAYCIYNRGMTDQTMRSKRYILRRMINETRIADIKELDNKAYNNWMQNQLKSGISGRTANIRGNHIIAFVKYLRDMDYEVTLKPSLVQKAKEAPPRREFFTREEIARVKQLSNFRELFFISLMFDSGLRLSEMANLRLKDVEGCEIIVIGKGGKKRTTFMSDETKNLFDRWVNEYKIRDYIIVSQYSYEKKPLSSDHIRQIMKQPFIKAGYGQRFYPHALRHSFATDLQLNGAPLQTTKDLLGHSSIVTTEVYIHTLCNSLQKEYKKYKPALTC